MVRTTHLLALALVATTGCRQLLGFEEPVVGSTAPEDAADPDPDTGAPADAPLVVDIQIDVDTATWTLRKPIMIDGAQVEATVSNFPVLVRIGADADLAASARNDGADLLFTAADGTKLAHEIESFDPMTGALVAWVAMPVTINTNTKFFLYFGNPASPDQQNVAAVWDSAYVGVWHLGETAGTTIVDSTGKHPGTKTAATSPAPAPGMIGGGQLFDGDGDGISIGNDAMLDIPSITFETWIQVPACTGDIYRRIIDFTVAFTSSWAVAYSCDGAPFANDKSVMLDLPNGSQVQTAVDSFTVDTPHHLVLETNGTKFYIDGVEKSTNNSIVGLAQDNINTIIGNRENTADRAVQGTMDEVRISNVRRSLGYIQTSHASQRPGSTFLMIGATEAAP